MNDTSNIDKTQFSYFLMNWGELKQKKVFVSKLRQTKGIIFVYSIKDLFNKSMELKWIKSFLLMIYSSQLT